MKIRLKELRKARGWNQSELASLLGISAPHVSEMEQGKKNPSRPLLEQMAKLFCISVADMYEPDTDGPTLHAMVDGIKSLSEKNRQMVNDLIQALLDKQDGQ